MYFSNVNPSMKYSGVMGDSKNKVLSLIPAGFIPKSVFLPEHPNLQQSTCLIQKKGMEYPFVVKPDVGERGKGVEIIRNESEFAAYLRGKEMDLIVQEYVELGYEFGVMYHRLPGEEQGKITSVTMKGFLTVEGDGHHTLSELLGKEIRVNSRLDYLENKFTCRWNKVVPENEKVLIEPIGNHSRGTKFLNANHLINDDLHGLFNSIADKIEGFYYGRFDLKVPDIESLYTGEKMKILELNGVSSEVAHIYDPDYSIAKAYRDTAIHMKYIYEISRRNKKLGYKFDSLAEFLKDLRLHFKHS